MAELHWAIHALRDIQNALDRDRYEIAGYHIDDAINALIAIDSENSGTTEETACSQSVVQRM